MGRLGDDAASASVGGRIPRWTLELGDIYALDTYVKCICMIYRSRMILQVFVQKKKLPPRNSIDIL